MHLENFIEIFHVHVQLTLKRQTKIAADDILIFYFYPLKKIRLDFSCESSASIKSYFLWITMTKYLWMSSAAFVIGALRVKTFLRVSSLYTGWERTVHISHCPALYSGRIFVPLCRELIIFVF